MIVESGDNYDFLSRGMTTQPQELTDINFDVEVSTIKLEIWESILKIRTLHHVDQALPVPSWNAIRFRFEGN